MSVESLTSTNLDAARALTAAGCPVFPFDPATEEPCVDWTECSTTDSAALEALWRRHPDALPAIDLGKAGLLVIDVSYDGLQPFSQIAAAHGLDTTHLPAVLTPPAFTSICGSRRMSRSNPMQASTRTASPFTARADTS